MRGMRGGCDGEDGEDGEDGGDGEDGEDEAAEWVAERGRVIGRDKRCVCLARDSSNLKRCSRVKVG
jgi:hypothetical protein